MQCPVWRHMLKQGMRASRRTSYLAAASEGGAGRRPNMLQNHRAYTTRSRHWCKRPMASATASARGKQHYSFPALAHVKQLHRAAQSRTGPARIRATINLVSELPSSLARCSSARPTQQAARLRPHSAPCTSFARRFNAPTCPAHNAVVEDARNAMQCICTVS